MITSDRPSRSEGLISPFSRRRSNRSSLEHKNVVSWRVPNSPKPTNNPSNNIQSRKSQTTSPKLNTREPSPVISEVVDDLKSLSAVSDMNLDDKVSETIDFQDRYWQMLYNNIEHAVDELYDLCEEEEDVNRCLEAINMFNQTTRDFTKLIEKIQAQRYYDIANPSALSWEIRKPRRSSNTTSPGSSHISKTSSNKDHVKALIDSSQTSGEKSISQEQAIVNQTIATINRLDEKFQSFSPKLRAEAKPFVPTAKASVEPIVISSVNSIASESRSDSQVNTNAAEKVEPASNDITLPEADNKVVEVTSENIAPTATVSPTLTPTASNQPSSKAKTAKSTSSQNSPKRPTPKATKADQGPPPRSPFRAIPPSNRHVTISSPKISSGIALREIEVDFDVQQEVALASEEVWAEAEAWVEAEAALEDAAWDQLEKDSPTPSISLNDRFNLSASSNNEADEVERLVVNKIFEGVELSLDEETVRTPSPLRPIHDAEDSVQSRLRQGLWTPSPRNSLLRAATFAGVGSQSVQPGSADSGRALHKKFFSPDRKKSSPTDLKRRYAIHFLLKNLVV